MSGNLGVVRSISWRDTLPWLILFRVFRLSVKPTVLLIATCGSVVTPLGWIAAGFLFQPETENQSRDFAQLVERQTSLPGSPNSLTNRLSQLRNGYASIDGNTQLAPPPTVVGTFWSYLNPLVYIARNQVTLRQFGFLTVGIFWSLCVWSIAAGAITRIAAVTLGREERMPFQESLKHAVRKFRSYISAPLIPLVGILLLSIPSILLGFLLQWDVGIFAASLLWVVILLLAFLSVLLLVGLFFGWPLMICAISSENSDAFDALSRSYAYTYQRPINYICYTAFAMLLGLIGWAIVCVFSEGVIEMAWWGASIGAGADRVAELQANLQSNANDPLAAGHAAKSSTYWAGTGVIAFCERIVRTLASAYGYSFFWCAATCVYLLLRLDVDQTEFDEVILDESDLTSHSLPPLDPPSETTDNTPEDSSASDST